MTDISHQEYWTNVSSLAEESFEDDRDDEARQDWIHETIDSHQWVIYTAYNFDVLKQSENTDYIVDNFGTEGIIVDGHVNWALLAYGALYGDVMEAAYRLAEEKESA